MRVRGLVFALVAAGIVAAGCHGGTPSVPLPPSTPFAPDVSTEVHAVRDLAAQARGLKEADNIGEGTITRDDLKSYYDAVAAQSRKSDNGNELGAWNTAYRLLQMIGPGEDALQEQTTEEATDVVGLYSPQDKELVLVDDGSAPLSLDDDITLAHEYVHSFQDASFDMNHLQDLEKKEKDDKLNTEYSTTVEALMEGDAEVASMDYLGLKLGKEGFTNWLNSAAGGASPQDQTTETALERYAAFPYREGTQFVLYLWLKGGWDQVNKAYADPPKTTEQILHPEKYLAHEEPVGLKLPDLSNKLGEGWKQLDDSVFGEFDVYNFLRTKSDDDAGSREAATGWNGGRIAIYTQNQDSERALVHLVLSWDTENDAIQFTQAFRAHVGSLADDQHPAPVWFSKDLQSAKMLWEGENEQIYGWADGQTFRAIFSVQQPDLEQAMSILAPGVTRDTIEADLASGQ
jgi:hypothetical protein